MWLGIFAFALYVDVQLELIHFIGRKLYPPTMANTIIANIDTYGEYIYFSLLNDFEFCENFVYLNTIS